MKKTASYIIALCLFTACSDDMDLIVDIPNDVTMNELELEDFTHNIPEGGFTSYAAHSNSITFNTKKKADGSYAGFAYSNRNNRSFTWTSGKAAIDTNMYSVYTRFPNATETYAVAHAVDGEAYFTLQQPTVVESILVANTTYAYLGMVYGDQYGTPTKPVANPNIPGANNKKGVWYSNIPGGVKKMTDTDKDYFKLIIEGYKGSAQTGHVDFYLCTRKADPEHPGWSRIVDDWYPVDLSSLGIVDKVVFRLESSDIDSQTGKMRTPAYFCLDGIRLKK